MERKQSVQRGFGLVQAIGIVVVLGAMMLAAILVMAGQSEQDARGAYIKQEAKDLAMLHEALMRYRDDNEADLLAAWGATAHQDAPSLAGMMASGEPHYLPDHFADRGLGPGHSPWWQPYQTTGVLLAVSAEETRPVWVAGETDAANQARLTQSGVTPETLAALKHDIVVYATERYGVPAAFVPAGGSTATGAMNAWSKDLGADFAGGFAVSDEPRAVVLAGYPDLEGEEVIEDPGTGWEHVTLRLGSSWGPDAECLPGTEVIRAFPACGRSPMDAFGSDIGTITFATYTTTEQLGVVHTPSNQTAKILTEMHNQILLNGALVGEESSPCSRGVNVVQGSREPDSPPIYDGPYYRHGPVCHRHVNGGSTPPEPIEGCILPGGVSTYYVRWLNPGDHSQGYEPVLNKFCGVPVNN